MPRRTVHRDRRHGGKKNCLLFLMK